MIVQILMSQRRREHALAHHRHHAVTNLPTLASSAEPTRHLGAQAQGRSTSRNDNAPPFEEIDPPKKVHRTLRLRRIETANASWLDSVAVWLLLGSRPTN